MKYLETHITFDLSTKMPVYKLNLNRNLKRLVCLSFDPMFEKGGHISC